MKERFKQIGRGYCVSNFGRVFNPLGYELKAGRDKRGYYRVTIGRKKCYIHLMVAKLFVKNPCNYAYVRHIDGDNANNRADNLVYYPNLRPLQENNKFNKYF